MSKKPKNPMKTLVKIIIALAVALALCAVIVTGITTLRSQLLQQKIADTELANKQKEQAYLIAKAEYENATKTGENLAWPTPKAEGWDVLDLSTFPLENTRMETVDRQSLLKGGLMLLNTWHALPADFTEEGLESVRKTTNSRVPVRDNDVVLFPAAAEAIDMLVMDAGLQGMKDYIVQNAYRTNEEQTNLWNKYYEDLSRHYEGEILHEQTLKKVNYPGTSDYQSGLSFEMKLYNRDDASITGSPFQETAQGQFFTDNCWKYGVIFRFPAKDWPNEAWTDKSYKTGVSSKLNLYRYVGVAHSTAMHVMEMCLEEYIEYLMEHPHIAIYEDGVLKYEIYRQPYGDEAALNISVPQAAQSYTASVDNMGGVVTAFVYE